MKKIYVKYDGFSRHIGDWDARNKIFYKEVAKSKHLFRVLNAWGMDAEYLKGMPDDALIKITEKEESKIYKVKAKDFKEKGQYFHFKKEEDHKRQLFLPLEHWNISELNYNDPVNFKYK